MWIAHNLWEYRMLITFPNVRSRHAEFGNPVLIDRDEFWTKGAEGPNQFALVRDCSLSLHKVIRYQVPQKCPDLLHAEYPISSREQHFTTHGSLTIHGQDFFPFVLLRVLYIFFVECMLAVYYIVATVEAKGESNKCSQASISLIPNEHEIDFNYYCICFEETFEQHSEQNPPNSNRSHSYEFFFELYQVCIPLM